MDLQEFLCPILSQSLEFFGNSESERTILRSRGPCRTEAVIVAGLAECECTGIGRGSSAIAQGAMVGS